MSNRFASGKKALAECDRCGFRYYLPQLRNEYVRGRNTGLRVCPICWDEDHPQNKLGEYPVDDPQAIRDPRPDFAGYSASRRKIFPVTPVVAGGF